jgi:hypothetical protein
MRNATLGLLYPLLSTTCSNPLKDALAAALRTTPSLVAESDAFLAESKQRFDELLEATGTVTVTRTTTTDADQKGNREPLPSDLVALIASYCIAPSSRRSFFFALP